MEFPGFDHVYLVENPGSKRAYQGRFDPREAGLEAREMLLGERPPRSTPFLVRHDQGEAVPGSCFWVSGIYGPVVATSICDLFRANKITGWDTFPVRVFAKSGGEVPGFVGLRTIARPVSVIDFTKGARLQSPRNPGRFLYVGGEFDLITWDGSDIFRSGNSIQFIVVERVKQILENAKLRNLRFSRLSEHDVMEYFALLLLKDAGHEVADFDRFSRPRRAP